MLFESFFNRVVDASWYAAFLQPVLDRIHACGDGLHVLDVGTGAGKLPQLLLDRGRHTCTAVDTNPRMLAHARERLAGLPVVLKQITPAAPFPLADDSHDIVCFCSVLFLLPDALPVLEEARRVLKPGGSILVLTPTGQVSFSRSLRCFSPCPFIATTGRFSSGGAQRRGEAGPGRRTICSPTLPTAAACGTAKTASFRGTPFSKNSPTPESPLLPLPFTGLCLILAPD